MSTTHAPFDTSREHTMFDDGRLTSFLFSSAGTAFRTDFEKKAGVSLVCVGHFTMGIRTHSGEAARQSEMALRTLRGHFSRAKDGSVHIDKTVWDRTIAQLYPIRMAA